MLINRDLRKALNYAYLNSGVFEGDIDKFKTQANKLLDSIDENKTEEFYKANLN
jgi:hypothetical protein